MRIRKDLFQNWAMICKIPGNYQEEEINKFFSVICLEWIQQFQNRFHLLASWKASFNECFMKPDCSAIQENACVIFITSLFTAKC